MADMICTMKQGERSEFLLHKLLPINNQVPPKGDEVAVFTIHLHSFHQGTDVWQLTDQERLEIAKKHKQQGSELFKSGHLRGASIRYSKAIQRLAAVDPDTPLEVDSVEEYEREIVSLRTASLMNLAACQLKFNEFQHVVRNCSRVLELDPRNLKGRYRRAKALLAMNDFEGSRSDLLKAREVEPGNQAVNELLRTLEAQEMAHRAKYREALKTMFN